MKSQTLAGHDRICGVDVVEHTEMSAAALAKRGVARSTSARGAFSDEGLTALNLKCAMDDVDLQDQEETAAQSEVEAEDDAWDDGRMSVAGSVSGKRSVGAVQNPPSLAHPRLPRNRRRRCFSRPVVSGPTARTSSPASRR